MEDVRGVALRRIPTFAKAFLESGTGEDYCLMRNLKRFQEARLLPRYLTQNSAVDMSVSLLGDTHQLPFAIAPIGLAGLIWPNAERRMIESAKKSGHVFCLGSLACLSLEETAAELGSKCWFQLYPMKDKSVQADLLTRCVAAGIDTLVVTIDVPTHNRREGMNRAGLSMPIRFTPRLALQAIAKPNWLVQTLITGQPRPINLLRYVAGDSRITDGVLFNYLSEQFGIRTGIDDLRKIRSVWPGKMIVKGVLTVEDARLCVDNGADGIIISNHGGRQLDTAPHPLNILPHIRNALEDTPLMLDSGVRSGSDVAVAIAHGADFVLLGRAYLYGAAAGHSGAEHVSNIISQGLLNVMAQLGCEKLSDLQSCLSIDGN